ncbi:MAG: MBL fold metallo-hydrolase [Bacteroidota bacterium]|nr:MBL fold metallo-hydrolase [Bacteroidota bacterium]
MKKILGLILALSIGLSSVFSQTKTRDLHVTYIANDGFMLKTKHHKILIDALFTDGYGYFATPTKETLSQIMNAEAPFDSVNFCFLSHYHKDHSDSKLMNDYLSKFPSVKLITTKPSLVFIDGEQFRFVKLKKQFCELTPETNKSIKLTIDNVTVKALGLKHMPYIEDGIDIEQYMKNVGFYINMDGVGIFHSGDTKMEQFKDYMAKNGHWKEPVDVAFVYYELLNNGKADLDYLKKTINPRHIVVMHMPPSLYGEWSKKVEQLKQTFPEITLFKDALENKTIGL